MRAMRCLYLFLTVMGASIFAYSRAVATASVEAELRGRDAAWESAIEAKDIEKILSFYTEDAMVLVDGKHIATGKAAIRGVLQGMLTRPNLKTHWAPTRIEVAKSRDLAYEVGTGTILTTASKGNSATWSGKYVFVWKKQPNGDWQVVVDMSNSDGA